MARINIWMFICGLLIVNACTQECTVVCEYEESIRQDTFGIDGVDTVWTIGQIGDQVWFQGDDGSELNFEITQYDTSFFSEMSTIACGECGDSIILVENTPYVRFGMSGENDMEILTTFWSDRRIFDSAKIFKCLEAEIEIALDNITYSGNFLPGCNIALDTMTFRELNMQVHDAKYFYERDTTMTCVVDSASLLLPGEALTPEHSIREVKAGRDGPIWGFAYDGICYRFQGIR